jgi:hypothetical protein
LVKLIDLKLNTAGEEDYKERYNGDELANKVKKRLPKKLPKIE